MKLVNIVLLSAFCFIRIHASGTLYPDSKLQEISFCDVRIDDPFWNGKLQTVQEVTLPLLLDMAEEQGKIDNFRIVAGKKQGKIKLFNAPDSDVYKLLEAVGYLATFRRSPGLEERCDAIIDDIVAAQDSSGYLNTQYALAFEHPASPSREHKHVKTFGYGVEDRWNSLSVDWPKGYSQLYCAGHLMEAAVSYHKGTGKSKLLQAAIRLADQICRVFDREKIIHYGEHPEVEIGLMKLYEETGNREYQRMAGLMCRYIRFTRPVDINREENSRPLYEQSQAYGHCVRTAYLYTGATHVLRAEREKRLNDAMMRLWHNVTGRKMYLHGGTGNGTHAEQHGENDDLPVSATYSECCANIAQGQWNHQMNLLTGDVKYAGIVELELFNSALSGISLDGKRFFYSNKLNIDAQDRKDSHSGVRETYLFCCPSKLPGFIAGIGRWAYAKDATGIYVNQYIGSHVNTTVSGTPVSFSLESDYAYNGNVRLLMQSRGRLSINFRIPQWVNQKEHIAGSPYYYDKHDGRMILRVNGKRIGHPVVKDGYVHIERDWKEKDVVELSFEMQVKRIYTTPAVTANSGRVALMYGPMLYCLEGTDHSFDVMKMILPEDSRVVSSFNKQLMGGICLLKGKGLVDNRPVAFKAIPYYCWANRGMASMSTLLIESIDKIEKEAVNENTDLNTNG